MPFGQEPTSVTPVCTYAELIPPVTEDLQARRRGGRRCPERVMPAYMPSSRR